MSCKTKFYIHLYFCHFFHLFFPQKIFFLISSTKSYVELFFANFSYLAVDVEPARRPGLAQTSLYLDEATRGVRTLGLLNPEVEVALHVVGDARGDQEDGKDEEEDDVESGGQASRTVWVGGWARVEAASGPRSLAVGRGPALVTVAASEAVTLEQTATCKAV